MALYLADAHTAPTAFALAAAEPDGVVVLMQDGVTRAPSAPDGLTCYALADDVERRGLAPVLGDGIRRITYAELVDLLFSHRVINLG